MRTIATSAVRMGVVFATLSACAATPDTTESTSVSQGDLAAAADPSDRVPVPFEPFTLPANRCGFPIDVAAVSNNESQLVTTLSDGTTITKITGRLVLSFTNDVSGVTIVRNVSGPSTETDNPDGSGTFLGTGVSWFAFGPTGQGNTGEPGLIFTSGRAELQFNSQRIATNFMLAGKQVNGCDLLR